MQREIFFDYLEHFVSELRNLDIRKIALTEVNEKRAVQVEPDLIQVVDIVIVEILAYRDSTIYKCRLQDTDPDDVHSKLTDLGFEIIRRNRNIT